MIHKPKLPDWAIPFWTTNSRYKIAQGGRGSSKSWTFCLMILMLGRKKKVRVLCCREIQTSIKSSVHQLMIDMLFRFGWESEYRFTQASIRHLGTGTFISFAGLKNNPESVKSTEAVDICFVEEAQTISEASMRLLIPTIRKPGSEIWLAMNPRYESDYCYKRFVTTTHSNVLMALVNWSDNPWFPEVLRQEMEIDKEDNPAMYLHTWEGHLRPYGERPLFGPSVLNYGEPKQFEHPAIYGLDLSYSGNNALIGLHLSEDKRELFIDSAKIRSKIPLQKMAEWIGITEDSIVVDSARPEVIRLLRDEGLSVRKSKKGAGSVLSGADRMAKFRKIWIAPGLDVVYEEFSKLGWNDNEELVGIRDCFDACRYGLERLGGTRVIPWSRIRRVA